MLAEYTPYIPNFDAEIMQLWWRVPLALIACVSILLVFNFAINNYESTTESRCEDSSSQSNSKVARSNTVHFLRIMFICSCPRFAWIYFASIDEAWHYQISHLEAFAWLAYWVLGFPYWLTTEVERYEAMRNMRTTSNTNT